MTKRITGTTSGRGTLTKDEDNRAYEAGYQQGHVVDIHIN